MSSTAIALLLKPLAALVFGGLLFALRGSLARHLPDGKLKRFLLWRVM